MVRIQVSLCKFHHSRIVADPKPRWRKGGGGGARSYSMLSAFLTYFYGVREVFKPTWYRSRDPVLRYYKTVWDWPFMLHSRCLSKCCQVTLSPGVEVLKVIVRMCDHGCSRDSVLETNKISPAVIKKNLSYIKDEIFLARSCETSQQQKM